MVRSRRPLGWILLLVLWLSLLPTGTALGDARSLINPPHHPAVEIRGQPARLMLQPAATPTPDPGPPPTPVPSSGDITDRSRPRFATPEGPWGEAVNLSLSGVANDPQIVAAPDGRLWAFWWDMLSGLVTTSYEPGGTSLEEGWSPPVVAPILVPELMGEGDEAEWEFNTVQEMPSISGAGGYAHALWLGQPDEETGLRPLMHSRLSLRAPLAWSTAWAWSRGRALAETALVWRLGEAPDGALHLVYMLPIHSETSPAGIYHRRSLDRGASWSGPTLLHDDIYVRRSAPEEAHLTIAADRGQRVYATWDDPRLGTSFVIASGDGGATWGEPHLVRGGPAQPAQGEKGVRRARVVPTSDQVLLLWESGGEAAGCALYQQRLVTTTATMTTTWSASRQVLEGLNGCPTAPVFVRTAEGNPVMLVGTGGETLTAVAWRGSEGPTAFSSTEMTASQSVSITSTVPPTSTTPAPGEPAAVQPSRATPGWSEPRSLTANFEHPELGQPVYLDQLRATLADGHLAVVGLDQYGDVWYLQSAVDAWEWAFAPPPAWSRPTEVSQLADPSGLPALTADQDGRVHALWGDPGPGLPPQGAGGGALTYARLAPSGVLSARDEPQWSRPAPVLQSPQGVAVQPVLVAHQDRVYALWSGGPDGPIYLSQAFAPDAYTPGGWSDPIALPTGGVTASSPVAVVDADGLLHIVYAATVNEGRGIYYLRFDPAAPDSAAAVSDGPQLVFDAQAAGWSMVDHPALALDPAGVLHVAWVRGSSAGPFPPQAVLHARSSDGGRTWSEPTILVEGAYDWPLVAAPVPGEVHVLWNQVERDAVWIHRWSLDRGQTWTYQQPVRGFRDVPGPAALATDGAGDLHLAGLGRDGQDAPALAYAVWRWDEERWEGQEPTTVQDALDPLPGIAAALQAPRGRLDVAIRAQMPDADGGTQPAVLHARRAIPTVAAAEAPASTPLPTATPTAIPTRTPSPTPRPAVEAAPPPTAPPSVALGPLSMPLIAIAGLGLAMLIILGAVAARAATRRR